ncbi:MAG: primosomal protein N' [Tissierellia bacterium]|nr:primosomal protein N' [Tissierellia bacterium]
MDRKYAQVIIDSKSSSTDRPYTYIIEPHMVEDIQVGMRVLVPFGRGNRVIKGLVIDIKDSVESNYQLKSIIDTIDGKPLVSKDMLELSFWMAKQYLCSYTDALKTVLPPGDFKEVITYVIKLNNPLPDRGLTCSEKDILELIDEHKGKIELEIIKSTLNNRSVNKDIKKLEDLGLVKSQFEIKTSIEKKYEKYISLRDRTISGDQLLDLVGERSYKQLEIGKYLLTIDEISLRELMNTTNCSLSTVKALERKGIINIYDREIYRNPINKDIKAYNKHKLTDEQKKCLDSILESIDSNTGVDDFLIHGVTGSGKTEIYLQLVEKMIDKGKDTIVLVPEISLTPQTIDRFVGRFGNNVAVLHSKLSYGEKFDEWRKIEEGKVKIVIGARSAIFAPFKNLGLVIIDEEHESTYKSSMNPKYNAIEVAKKRCKQVGAYLVRGSATPSVESYYQCKENNIKLLSLKKRVNQKNLPEIEVIDMREELNNGNNTIFSRALYNSIKKNLIDKKQTILFLNRRGYSTFVSCRKCGYVIKCDDCSISMTYHMTDNLLKCHYCGSTIGPPKTCPVCKSKYIKYFGVGTEKVEEYAKKLFPQAVIKRLDMDTTSRKGSHDLILDKMKNNKIDILIGTQMIAKGLDFKNVTLVGVIAADTTLNLPDYKSSERTFQLITQVAGRAGRGEFGGKVIVQTYNPEHYSIQCAKDYDYIGFYNKEILIREEFAYPPFTNIISIVIYGEDNSLVANKSKEVYNVLIEEIQNNKLDEVLEDMMGPYPAPLEKIKNNYRYLILIKCGENHMDKLREIVKWVCIFNKRKVNFDGIKISIDINPSSIL